MSKLQDDGKPLRDHLNSLWRQTREQPEQLANAPSLEPLTQHLWEQFVGIRNSANISGTERFTAQGIRDWCFVQGAELSLWERRTFWAMDIAWAAEVNSVR